MKAIELALIATAVVSGPGVLAQSLGDVARQAAERRQATGTPSQVITNKDLRPRAAMPAPPAPSTVAAPAATANTPPEPKYLARDASYWLGRMRELQTRRDHLKLQAAALEQRLAELQKEFDELRVARYRGMQPERERLRTELVLVRADFAATARQIFDLEEEARRSNVPPGWLRP